jgi:hypothetical protein
MAMPLLKVNLLPLPEATMKTNTRRARRHRSIAIHPRCESEKTNETRQYVVHFAVLRFAADFFVFAIFEIVLKGNLMLN